MDYLNPQKELRHRTILFMGYGLIAIAIALTTLVLVYQAYGFGLAKQGTVIQSGLTFFSSQPNPATITLNGKVNKAQTNARLTLPENIYNVVLSRDGYESWKRTIQVEGGSVQHFDYPFLVPKQLVAKKIAAFTAPPSLASQSMDKRWLIIQKEIAAVSFEVYDLKNPTKPPTAITMPDTVATKATTSESWIQQEWADDNTHLILKHTVDSKVEYIMLNRTNPEQSVNLSTTLSGTFTELTLINRKYDLYHLYDAPSKTLSRASIEVPSAKPILQHVLNFKSYSDDTILYATDEKAPIGKVIVNLLSGTTTTRLRMLPSGTTYPLDLTKYDGSLFVVLGAASENKIAVYKDPVGQLAKSDTKSLAPSQVLHVDMPNYVSFSSSAQFVMAENGTQFAIYDVENDRGYNYTAKQPLDTPAVHASWMDGNRLTYVSRGAVVFFDYDYTNLHTLVPSSSRYMPAFSRDYAFLYTLPAAASGETNLTQTSLRAPADQ